MRTEMVEVMRDQVHAIYRALTGRPLAGGDGDGRGEGEGEGDLGGEGAAARRPGGPGPVAGGAPAPEADLDTIEQRFGELEALARTLPALAGRVPPFSFTPMLDAVETERGELVLELAVPGVDRDDLAVALDGEVVRVSGLRRGLSGGGRAVYLSAEIPRGPFYRQIRLGFTPRSAPRVEVDRGVVRISISTTTQPATEGSEHETGRDG